MLALGLLLQLGDDPGVVAPEAADRDNSARAIHQRIMVLDGWLGSGRLPCGSGDDPVDSWTSKYVDSGIWWLRSRSDLEAARCWLRSHKDKIHLATAAGDAPRLHTRSKRTIYLGVIGPGMGELPDYYRAGVRFVRAPRDADETWLTEASRLGMAVDVAEVAVGKLQNQIARDGPSLLYSWSGTPRPALDKALILGLAEIRGGAILVLPGIHGTGIANMRECLGYVGWPHCAIGGAADPVALSVSLLGSGYTEANLARMFGFDLLRVLRSAEVWSRSP